jgi:hypothetical protein
MSGPIGSHPLGCLCPQCNGHPVGCKCFACNYFSEAPGLYITLPPESQFRPTESPELTELRALRAEVRELAKTQAGMLKLVKRALAKGKKR